MKNRLNIILLVVLSLASCNNGTIKAKIFERKEIADSNLLIKFRYKVNDNFYVDSAVIKNRVLGSDEVKIKVDQANPAKAVLATDR